MKRIVDCKQLNRSIFLLILLAGLFVLTLFAGCSNTTSLDNPEHLTPTELAQQEAVFACLNTFRELTGAPCDSYELLPAEEFWLPPYDTYDYRHVPANEEDTSLGYTTVKVWTEADCLYFLFDLDCEAIVGYRTAE